jgi:hypothetical protein
MVAISKVLDYLKKLSLDFQIDSKTNIGGISVNGCSKFQFSVDIRFGTLMSSKVGYKEVIKEFLVSKLKEKVES